MTIQYKIVSVLILLISISNSLHAQEQLNDYKYVVVPDQFEFQSEANQYRINGLTKFLLEKQNFTVFSNNQQLPEDAINNGCLVVYASLINSSSLFNTKVAVQFENCRKDIVFTSQIGASRDKKYIVAYNEATRNAFKTFSSFTHNYVPKVDQTAAQVTELKEEIKTLKADKKEENLILESDKPETKDIVKSKVANNNTPATQNKQNKTLKAHLIEGAVFSYNLKDATNTVVYTILFSGKEDYYIVKGLDALIYKINNQWVIAQYLDTTLQVKSLDIKF